MKHSSVHRCIRSVRKAVEAVLEESVQCSFRNSDENETRATEFEAAFNVPGVVGVLDGSHIPLWHRSTGSHDPYYNRKGFFSFVLSAIVDARGRFINIDVGGEGGRHDAYIFETSNIGRWFHTAEARECLLAGRQFLLADSAYGLHWYLMKAFDRRNVLPESLQQYRAAVDKQIRST